MPYFIILPAYAGFLFLLVAVSIIFRFTLRWQPVVKYIIGGGIGTLPGFLLANVFITLVGVFPVWVSHRFAVPDWLEVGCKLFAATALLIGPFIASAVGVSIGFAAGAYFVWLRRRRHAA